MVLAIRFRNRRYYESLRNQLSNPMATGTYRALPYYIHEGFTTNGRQIARVTNFHTVAPNINISTVMNFVLFHSFAA
jgi:hypothetical protein